MSLVLDPLVAVPRPVVLVVALHDESQDTILILGAPTHGQKRAAVLSVIGDDEISVPKIFHSFTLIIFFSYENIR